MRQRKAEVTNPPVERDPVVGAPAEQRLLTYADLPARTFRRLPLSRTLAVLSVSPLEVHGPHLPLGTDILIAQAVARRGMLRFLQAHPTHVALLMPPLPIGADTVGHPGSVEVGARVVRDAVIATGTALAKAGLRGLVITNFHGGPRHNVELERATRTLRRRFPRFLAISPMADIFSRVFAGDPEMRARMQERSGLTDVELAQSDGELHAGMMETSAVLAEQPDHVLPDYRLLPAEGTGMRPLFVRAARTVRLLGPLLGRKRAASLARDLAVLVDSFGWLHRPWKSYVGAPALASAPIGEALLELLGDELALLVGDLLSQRRQPEDLDPLSWSIRWLLRLPGGFRFQEDPPA